MKFRLIAVLLIKNNKGEYLICKKPEGLGVYPGKWALPGGGIEKGERMDEAVHREVKEEVALKVKDLEPLYFRDTVATKYYANGKKERLYMIYLYFDCRVASGKVKLGDEFEDYAWVKPNKLESYDLNKATRMTFKKLKLI